MPIRKLPVLLVNQIAAGEVIERPASVVKELVENSLDARATRIEVAVEDGGRQLIRVSDDGVGIPMEELPLAVAPHATSKIESAQDLAAIRTLGFRGEALASIASVSRLRLVSRATVDGATAEAAGLIEASGEQVSPVQPASGSPGTVVEVRDLFFNTPARRKFLRSASTEMGHISDIIARLAMVHPRVGFRLTHNGRTVIDLPAESSHARRVVAVLGRDLEEGLLEFELIEPVERGGNRVWGLAGQPALARATSRFQYLSVNSRPIRDRYLAHAVKEAYRGLIPPDQQPVAAVFIEIDPAAVDVNAHPAKAEVRFRQPQQVHGLVLAAIRQRLLGSDLTPSWSPPGASAAPVLPLPAADAASAIPATPAAGSATDDSVTRQFVDYFRRMDPTQKGFVYQEVKRVIQEELPQAAEEDSGVADSLPQENWSLKPQSILQVHRSYVV
ncbi:MAG TPA: DNA mismatch repair endonuclease MutL, partial [Phycisphaeraceae bacterium]